MYFTLWIRRTASRKRLDVVSLLHVDIDAVLLTLSHSTEDEECGAQYIVFDSQNSFNRVNCRGPSTTIYLTSPTADPTGTVSDPTGSSETTSTDAQSDDQGAAITDTADQVDGTPATNDSDPADRTAVIVGGTVGGIAITCVTVLLGIYLRRKSSNDAGHKTGGESNGDSGPQTGLSQRYNEESYPAAPQIPKSPAELSGQPAASELAT